MKRGRVNAALAWAVGLVGTLGAVPAFGQTGPGSEAPRLLLQNAAGDWVPKLVPRTCAAPLYPLASQRAGETGSTRVRLVVSETGDVTDVEVVTSSGSPRLDAATKDALSLCRFTPARDSTGQATKSSFGMLYQWRADNPVEADPWDALRARNGAGYAATADLAGVPFSGSSALTSEQRLRILRRVQQQSGEQAGCRSIEQVVGSDAPAAFKANPLRDKKTGREIPSIREMWTVTECGLSMGYALLVQMPEDYPPTFLMTPMGAASHPPSLSSRPAALPRPSYAARIVNAIKQHIVYPQPKGKASPDVVAEVRLQVAPDGTITSHETTKHSADPAWDRAIDRAIERTGRLPLDEDGRVPPVVVVVFKPA